MTANQGKTSSCGATSNGSEEMDVVIGPISGMPIEVKPDSPSDEYRVLLAAYEACKQRLAGAEARIAELEAASSAASETGCKADLTKEGATVNSTLQSAQSAERRTTLKCEVHYHLMSDGRCTCDGSTPERASRAEDGIGPVAEEGRTSPGHGTLSSAPVTAEPVAWLKEWGDGRRRVDLDPSIEVWMKYERPTVTPLYRSVQPADALTAALEDAANQRKGWEHARRHLTEIDLLIDYDPTSDSGTRLDKIKSLVSATRHTAAYDLLTKAMHRMTCPFERCEECVPTHELVKQIEAWIDAGIPAADSRANDL